MYLSAELGLPPSACPRVGISSDCDHVALHSTPTKALRAATLEVIHIPHALLFKQMQRRRTTARMMSCRWARSQRCQPTLRWLNRCGLRPPS